MNLFFTSKAAGDARAAASVAATASRRCRDEAGDTWACKQLGRTAGTGHEMDHLLRNLRRMGRSVPIRVTQIAVPYFNDGMVNHPILTMTDFIRHMLTRGHAAKLLGGYDLSDQRWQHVVAQWWERYKLEDPTHSVFSDFQHQRNVVPLMLYGDEGTGKRRHPVWILAWKPVLFCRPSAWWRSFLFSVVAHEAYAGFHAGVTQGNPCLDAVLQSLASEARQLYIDGLEVSCGEVKIHLHFAFIGTVGDLPWQAKVWRQVRHFERNDFCPHCLLVKDAIGDLGTLEQPPAWHNAPARLPWSPTNVPILASIPGLDRAGLFRHDIFHLGHLGIARRFVCSTLIVLCQTMGFFNRLGDGRALATRLARAYQSFRSWCAAAGSTPLIKEFTPSNIGRKGARCYPDCSYKASDCQLIMGWLQDLFEEPFAADQGGVLECIATAVIAYNSFFRQCCLSAKRVC